MTGVSGSVYGERRALLPLTKAVACPGSEQPADAP